MNPVIFKEIAIKIIQRQEEIIGPVAWLLARKVKGLAVVDSDKPNLQITEDPRNVLNELVGKYEYLFGKLGILQCRDAADSLLRELKPDDVPERLR